MKIWSIANQKGGVGKTTTTVSLAGILAQKGERCLLLDADPHGSLSVYLGNDPDTHEGGLYQLFHEPGDCHRDLVKQQIISTDFENIDLLPASTAMAALDRQMGTKQGKGLVFSKSLACLHMDYDYVLIDCPPQLGILMVNALAVCEQLLVPVQTEFLALKGLERMVNTLHMIMQSRNATLSYTVIPTLYDKRTKASRGALQVLQEQYQDNLWPGVIPIDTQFREASCQGMPLSMFAPKAKGVVAYKNLLSHLLGELEQVNQVVA